MIPPDLSACNRPRFEDYRISDADKFARQNVKGAVTSLPITFAVPGPAHKRQTGNGVADIQTVAQVAKSIAKVGTQDGYISLCRDASVRCCRNFGRNWRELREPRWRIDIIGRLHHAALQNAPPRGREFSRRSGTSAQKSFDQDDGQGARRGPRFARR